MLLFLIQYLPRGIVFTQTSIRNLFKSQSFLETKPDTKYTNVILPTISIHQSLLRSYPLTCPILFSTMPKLHLPLEVLANLIK